MSLGARLESLRGSVPMAEFAAMFKIHKNTYANYAKNQNVPDSNFILGVCKKFGVSADWLLMGIGSKYLDQHVHGSSVGLSEKEQFVLLPMFETWIIDREGEIVHDGILEYVPFKRQWLESSIRGSDGSQLKSLLMTRVRKDYMIPTIGPGDLVVLNTARELRSRPKTGDIYLVRLPDGERALKRVAVVTLNGSCRIILFSDNVVAYGPVEFNLPSADEIPRVILGRVQWVLKQLQEHA